MTYSQPVAQAAGVILDTDTRTGPTYEEWTVEALDASMNVLETVVFTAQDRPDSCNAGQGPVMGGRTRSSSSVPAADISFVLLRYTGTATDIGLAFDSFSPTTIPPAPSIVASVPQTDPCTYDIIELGSEIFDGLAIYTYQWQKQQPGGGYIDVLNAIEPTLEVAAIEGDTYRVMVTDVLERVAISDPVTIGFARFVNIELSVETAAPTAASSHRSATATRPSRFDTDIDTLYEWSNAEEFYHGADPALTIDQSHLFLTVAPGGLSLVNVYDGVGTNAGGRAEMRMEFTGVTPDYVSRDDPSGDLYRGAGTSVLETRHNWSSPNTDGWAIGPLQGSWSVDISFADGFTGEPEIDGLTSWTFFDRLGASIALPLELDRRVRITATCGCGPADLNTDGAVNFFDVSAFLSAYNAQDPIADFNGDGMLNFFDVSAFLSAFGAGCP
ncbi:MAG: GC-type dockerin domain-anchored protein [Phycisphaerales bacterium]